MPRHKSEPGKSIWTPGQATVSSRTIPRNPGQQRTVPDRYLQVSTYASATPDDVEGAFALTNALIEAGHTRIGHLSGETWIEAGLDRLKGYRQALAAHSIPSTPPWRRTWARWQWAATTAPTCCSTCPIRPPRSSATTTAWRSRPSTRRASAAFRCPTTSRSSASTTTLSCCSSSPGSPPRSCRTRKWRAGPSSTSSTCAGIVGAARSSRKRSTARWCGANR